MFWRRSCNTNWSQQTVRLFSGTDTTVYAFLPQICAAYLLVVSLQKRVKTNKKQNNNNNNNNNNNKKELKREEKKKTGRGLGETFAHMGLLTFSNISKAYRVLRSTDQNYRFCPLKIPAQNQGGFFHQLGKTH